MKNKAFLILLIAAILGAGIYAWWLYKQNESLKLSLAQEKKTRSEMKADAQRLAEEKEKLQQQLDKIQADALTYVATNTKLQLEKENLEKRIVNIQEEMKRKETILSGVKTEAQQVQSEELTKLQKELEKLQSENRLVGEKLESVENEAELFKNTSEREKAVLYYNLGVAYTSAKLYDEAIAAYEKSLQYNSFNPPAYYNLGLIYENIKLDAQKAVASYQRYIMQSPHAPDRDEVISWIKKLQ